MLNRKAISINYHTRVQFYAGGRKRHFKEARQTVVTFDKPLSDEIHSFEGLTNKISSSNKAIMFREYFFPASVLGESVDYVDQVADWSMKDAKPNDEIGKLIEDMLSTPEYYITIIPENES